MCATSGSSSAATGSSRQSMSKMYSAAPDVPIVASAVEVRAHRARVAGQDHAGALEVAS